MMDASAAPTCAGQALFGLLMLCILRTAKGQSWEAQADAATAHSTAQAAATTPLHHTDHRPRPEIELLAAQSAKSPLPTTTSTTTSTTERTTILLPSLPTQDAIAKKCMDTGSLCATFNVEACGSHFDQGLCPVTCGLCVNVSTPTTTTMATTVRPTTTATTTITTTVCPEMSCGGDQFMKGICAGTEDSRTCQACANAICPDYYERKGFCQGRKNDYFCVSSGSPPPREQTTTATATTATTTLAYVPGDCHGRKEPPTCGRDIRPAQCTSSDAAFAARSCPVMCGKCTTRFDTTTTTTTTQTRQASSSPAHPGPPSASTHRPHIPGSSTVPMRGGKATATTIPTTRTATPNTTSTTTHTTQAASSPALPGPPSASTNGPQTPDRSSALTLDWNVTILICFLAVTMMCVVVGVVGKLRLGPGAYPFSTCPFAVTDTGAQDTDPMLTGVLENASAAGPVYYNPSYRPSDVPQHHRRQQHSRQNQHHHYIEDCDGNAQGAALADFGRFVLDGMPHNSAELADADLSACTTLPMAGATSASVSQSTHYTSTWRNIWIRDVFYFRIPAPMVQGPLVPTKTRPESISCNEEGWTLTHLNMVAFSAQHHFGRTSLLPAKTAPVHSSNKSAP